jgi:hypothetical protein
MRPHQFGQENIDWLVQIQTIIHCSTALEFPLSSKTSHRATCERCRSPCTLLALGGNGARHTQLPLSRYNLSSVGRVTLSCAVKLAAQPSRLPEGAASRPIRGAIVAAEFVALSPISFDVVPPKKESVETAAHALDTTTRRQRTIVPPSASCSDAAAPATKDRPSCLRVGSSIGLPRRP